MAISVGDHLPLDATRDDVSRRQLGKFVLVEYRAVEVKNAGVW